MASNTIRTIDQLGRVAIPKEICKALKIKEGDPLEVQYNYDGKILIRKYHKSFEQCCHNWYERNHHTLDNCQFFIKGDYTFCIVRFPSNGLSRAGHAKRLEDDEWDSIVGNVAAYANTMGRNLNKMVGYEG